MANEVKIKVSADTKKAEQQLKGFSGSVQRTSDKLRSFRGPMLGVTAAVGGLGIASVKAASDLEESINAVNVVFGEGAKTIHAFGENSAQGVGLSTAAFNELATVTGALLVDVGIPLEDAAEKTNALALRAADMASVFNVDVKTAMDAMVMALRGETEAIRRYGGDVTDATLQTFALAQGIEKAVSEMTQEEKRLLRLQTIMEQTEKFAGDFAATKDSLANSIKVTGAEAVNTAATFGAILAPAVAIAAGVVGDAIKSFNNLSDPMKRIIVIVAGVALGMAVLGLVIPPLVATLGFLAGRLPLLLVE